MLDSFGRKINYLRISITDRCNLRCVYCYSQTPHFPKAKLLTYEEILRLCEIFARLGVDYFRITGGEPLMRNNCVEFIASLKSVVKSVTLTTNGVINRITELKNANLDGINISLDCMDSELYKKITGIDAFAAVMATISDAVRLGIPTKINAVILEGVNDHQILPLVKLAEEFPVSVRFIELMPNSSNSKFAGVPSKKILAIAGANLASPVCVSGANAGNAGPASYYRSGHMQGQIGVISPTDEGFCRSCNRLRLTSTGFLRLCLHHEEGLDLRTLVRSGASNNEISRAITTAVSQKPLNHQGFSQKTDIKKIGG